MNVKYFWRRMPIKQKMRLCVFFLLLAILVAAWFNYYVVRFSVSDINDILIAITRCENAQDAMNEEENAFRTYVRQPSEDNYISLTNAVVHSNGTLTLLPSDYMAIGAERTAVTWRLRNAYNHYSEQRDTVCEKISAGADAVLGSATVDEDPDLVRMIYQVYDMQRYIGGYLQNLSQLTVEYASDVYDLSYPILRSVPYLQGGISLLLVLTSFGLMGIFTGSIVTPIQELVAASKNISQGKWDGEDIRVDSKDELGELVDSFNNMWHVTRDNIHTYEENQRLSEQLHEEEMERARTEKLLASARMDLLQSQIKPHFLFNILNTISGMAELEEAPKTEEMILALSRLFRYNLHTTDQFVSLSQEIEVVRDYMYLQRMRFGERVQYEIPPVKNPDWSRELGSIMVPVFILQPLVENAVIHGISKKENGGKVTVDVEKNGEALVISVSDTGVGMDPVKLGRMLDRLRGGTDDVHVGVGIGNLYQRLTTLYGADSVRIESAPDRGTQVHIMIPLNTN
jgi:sensor histidine kinase YesM